MNTPTRWQFWAAVVLLFLCGAPARAASTSVTELIRDAGDAADEIERLKLLRQLAARPELDATLRQELDAFLPIVTNWADGKVNFVPDDSRAAENGYLCWFFNDRMYPAADKARMFPVEPRIDSPLHPLWAYYRARMMIWMTIQNSSLLRVKETRDTYYGEARTLLAEAQRAFPKNPVIGMYLGRPIPWPSAFAVDPNAPTWANLQRESLEKLGDIIHWWIRERQQPDGQFGGGWGDDVEMWRWWVPVMIAFEDPVVTAAQAKLSNGMFAQPHLRTGFTTRLTDVEHSNEDTTDTIVPMMHLAPDDALWSKRALRLTELMRERWTGHNQRGFWQFKSIWFSVNEVDEAPRFAFDTVYHTAIVAPTLLYWQRTGDQELTKIFSEWLKVWIDAAAREENSKPAGILPSTISWPAGSVGTIVPGGKSWWQPFPLDDNDALYNWPGATELMTSTLLLSWHMTGDKKFLAPLESMAAYVREHGAEPEGAPGSPSWIARQMRGFLGDTLGKYRFLSGDHRYDDLLTSSATGYTRFRLGGDLSALEKDLEETARAFRVNREGYTSEVRWTDRVLTFPGYYLRDLPDAPPMTDAEILYHCATGDPGTPLIFAMNAVRWRTPPREIAALVTESSASSFSAQLYHFGAAPRKFAAELLLLKPGEYDLVISEAATAGQPRETRTKLRVTEPRTTLPLELASRRLTTVTIKPSGRP